MTIIDSILVALKVPKEVLLLRLVLVVVEDGMILNQKMAKMDMNRMNIPNDHRQKLLAVETVETILEVVVTIEVAHQVEEARDQEDVAVEVEDHVRVTVNTSTIRVVVQHHETDSHHLGNKKTPQLRLIAKLIYEH